MKRILLLSCLTVILPFLKAQNNSAFNLQDKWVQVEKLINSSLPESADKELSLMLGYAEKAGLFSEQLKIHLTRYRLQTDKDGDAWQQVLVDMEKMIKKLPEIPLKRIAFSLLSDFYNTYYQNNRNLIDRRTETVTELPEDISTWTRNQFKSKIFGLQQQALNEPEMLHNIPVTDYADFFHFDNSKTAFPPYLYDFLVLSQIKKFNLFNESEKSSMQMAKLIKFTKESGKSSILPFYELQLLNYTTINQDDKSYIAKLDSLEQIYYDIPAVVEILHAKAQWYKSKPVKEGNKRIAYRICEEGIQKFPEYERIGLLKGIINEIATKRIVLQHKAFISSGQSLKVDATTTNVTEMILEILRINTSPEKYHTESLSGRSRKEKNVSLIDTILYKIPFNPDFDEEKSNFEIPLPGYGIYLLRARPTEKTDFTEVTESEVTVSDLAFMKRMYDGQKTGIYLLDRTSGRRIAGAKIEVFEYKWTGSAYSATKKTEVISNRKGYAEYSVPARYANNFLLISRENDKFLIDNSFAGYLAPPPPPAPDMEISMFTDRGLYRPGQTVYVKIIAHKSDGEINTVVAGAKVPVELFDVNGTLITTKELTTNEFGSATTEFIIPTGSLNGNWSIVGKNYSHLSFQVEEYKLPGFEVILNKPVDEVSFGKNVLITGEIKAFAGNTLPESTIRYKIFRITHPFWRFFPRAEEKLIGSGETITDSKGAFEVNFTPEKDAEINTLARGRQSYIYRISVDATDLKGETQQGNMEISVSEQSLFINASIKDIISVKEKIVMPVEVVNIEGGKLTRQLTYTLTRLADTEEYSEDIALKDYSYNESETVLEGVFQSSEANLKLDFLKYKPGRYKLLLKAIDDKGNEIKFEKILVLFNPSSRKPPVKTYAWQLTQRVECEPGGQALIKFGTSLQKAHILMEVLHGNEVVSSRWMIMSDCVKTFRIPFNKKYKEGLEVNFSFIRNGRLFVRNFVISTPKKNYGITPKLNIFRDKLSPGEHAEWSVIIPDTKQQAELMLSMYDASLDNLHPHSWSFNPIYNNFTQSSPRWTSAYTLNSTAYGNFFNQQMHVTELNKTSLKNWEINLYGNMFNIFRRRVYGVQSNIVAFDSDSQLKTMTLHSIPENQFENPANFDIKNENQEILKNIDDEPQLIKKDYKPQQLRTNFNETAFFYPQVYADSTGSFRFSFTMPESLTRWNLKMLAHTKNLHFGQAMETVTTSKELMIRLNKPRFVRESDITELNASIVNLSEKQIKIKAVIKLTDTNDGQEINIQTAKEQIVVLQAGESKAVSWVVGTLYDRNLLVCSVEAESESFRDGEQHYLTVLPDRILVTETKPFTVKGNETLNLSFDDWKAKAGKAATSSLWVEFTANPVWFALQALPAIAETKGESTSDLFISWYSRKKALQILDENPLIKKTFDQMAALGNLNELLQSPLSKNEALKNLILQETPWVNAAKNETEQMQRIMLLFNNNNQQDFVRRTFEKFTERQLHNGGFSWYPGMPESRWISQLIAEGLTQILFEQDDATRTMIEKLLNYLDYTLYQDYQLIRKQTDFDSKRMTINTLQLQYLVIRTHFREYNMKQDHVEAYEYFLRQTEEHRHRLSLYEKALAARVLHRLKKSDAARELIQSLRETAIKSTENGMFWANNKAGYYWNERPVSVHAEIMQAMHEVGGQSSDLQEMKIWLMRQKQTQQWNSPIASLHAIEAITSTGNGLIMNAPQYNIAINDQEISNKQVQPGAGYVLQKVNEAAIPNNIRITPPVTSTITSLAWGAVYWQYFTGFSDLTDAGSGLRLSKTYFLSQTVNNVTKLIPLDHSEAQQLKTGDRIVVRLIVNTDRNLEFVALKDLRAACLEPLNQISGTQWKERLIYYRTTSDASTQYFFQHLPKGSYVFEDVYFINSTGDYSGGLASIQCQYAPEFNAHSPGQRITIKR